MMIVDRIEGKTVVIEDGERHFNADISLFDGDIREGDVIIEKDGRYFSDSNATEKRREDIIKLQDSLWE
ncbi:MAG: DUF3006 domain-containing protein [Oscillospiraceae bacterium]